MKRFTKFFAVSLLFTNTAFSNLKINRVLTCHSQDESIIIDEYPSDTYILLVIDDIGNVNFFGSARRSIIWFRDIEQITWFATSTAADYHLRIYVDGKDIIEVDPSNLNCRWGDK